MRLVLPDQEATDKMALEKLRNTFFGEIHQHFSKLMHI